MKILRIDQSVLIAFCLMLLAPLTSAQDFTSYTGPQLYQRFCSSCHGADARGDGPVAPALKVRVPDLTRLTRLQGDEFPTEQVRRIVDGRMVFGAHGPRNMPVWGYEFATATVSEPDSGAAEAAALVDRLVGYLESIQYHRTPSSSPSPASDP